MGNDEKTADELLDLERAICSDSQDLEHWKSHYIAAMMNWNIALDTIDQQRAELQQAREDNVTLTKQCEMGDLVRADLRNELTQIQQQLAQSQARVKELEESKPEVVKLPPDGSYRKLAYDLTAENADLQLRLNEATHLVVVLWNHIDATYLPEVEGETEDPNKSYILRITAFLAAQRSATQKE